MQFLVLIPAENNFLDNYAENCKLSMRTIHFMAMSISRKPC